MILKTLFLENEKRKMVFWRYLSMKCNKKEMKILSLSLVTIVSAALLLTGCGAKKAVQTGESIKNVRTVKADVASVATNVEYPGKLEPVQQISVSPKSPGKVAAVKVDVGAHVKAGDLLFTLDAQDLQAQLRQQQASLELSKANLTKTEGSGLEQQMLSAEQSLQKAQTAYNDAKDNYNKMKQLFDADAISKQDFTNIETRYNSAQDDLDFAKNNYELLKQKSGPESVNIASAQLHQAKAGVDSMSVQLGNSEIRSPISGIVSTRNVDKGEIVSSAVASFTIIDTTALMVSVDVSDKMIGKITKGQIIPVKISAAENATVNGIVDNVSPSSDAKTQLYTIKIKIDNSRNELKPGMFARAVLPAESRANVLLVPNSAVKTENNVQYIYIVADGKVKKVAVETGLSNDKVTEIKKPLKKGDLVIIEGQTFLNDGEKVNVIY
jgi:multidrug efflux pump subunit AcrA (membrane-fusion protein)